MANVASVAAYIIDRFDGEVGAIKLQKLVYYTQGWHLAAHAERLFNEPVKAYEKGPVVGRLWNLHRGLKTVTREQLVGENISPLTAREQSLVDAVLDSYGALDQWYLVKLTHLEEPWVDAWDDDYDDRITVEAMHDYFAHVAAVPSAAKVVPDLRDRSVTYMPQSDLDALGDLDEPDDVSGLLNAIKSTV